MKYFKHWVVLKVKNLFVLKTAWLKAKFSTSSAKHLKSRRSQYCQNLWCMYYVCGFGCVFRQVCGFYLLEAAIKGGLHRVLKLSYEKNLKGGHSVYHGIECQNDIGLTSPLPYSLKVCIETLKWGSCPVSNVCLNGD